MAMTIGKVGTASRRASSAAGLGDRPYLVHAPESGAVLASERAAIIEIRRDAAGTSLAGSTHPGDGLLSIFSHSAFSIRYSARKADGLIGDVAAAVVPAPMDYEIVPSGVTYLFRTSAKAAGAAINAPVGYTMDYVAAHLSYGRANKLAVPVLLRGEKAAEGGERITADQGKRVVIGPAGQELSAGNSRSPQESHLHSRLVETYTPLGQEGMTLYYEVHGRVESLDASFGDTIIVPPGIAHKARLLGEAPTFVTMTSQREIYGDKIVVPVDLEGEARGRDRLNSIKRD